MGPFQKTVRASASAAAKARWESGPMSSPSWSSGIASAATTVAGASAENSGATTTSVGRTICDAGLLRPAEVLPADLDLVLLQQALADLVALGHEEGEDHAAADEQPVGLAEQVVDDAELVGDLGPAEHHRVGTLGVLGQPAQHLDLGVHQAAHGVREQPRDVVHAGLLAVHDAEAVGDEDVGQRGELAGERLALGLVLAGLARVEADVLQHRHLAVREALTTAARALSPTVSSAKATSAPSSSPEAGGDRAQGVRRVRRTLRPPEVGHHRHPRARLGQPAQGGQAGPDAPVVGDALAVERDVEVGPHQHGPAPEVTEVVDRRHRSGPDAALRGSCRRG